MHICIDARWIFQEITGIGLYTQELIHALSRVDTRNQYTLLFNSPDTQLRTIGAARLADAPNFRCHAFDAALFSIRNQMRLPSLLQQIQAQVYHSTNYMMPLLPCGRTRRVITIHDLIPLMFRDHAPKAKKARLFPIYKRLMNEVARRADRIIAVSESTRQDIVRELNAPTEKIHVTLEGVTPEHVPADKKPRDEKTILFVGRRDPYKNLTLLIQSFAALLSRAPNTRLRVIGPADERYPEAPELARRLGIAHRVDWIGYATPAQLIEAYQQTDLFVLPSRYEGFGLTVLEAMACGAPVVCSEVSSLPEVVGDAGLLVPPGNATELADAMAKILTDAALAADLRRRGIHRASLFSWEKTARETLKVYESFS